MMKVSYPEIINQVDLLQSKLHEIFNDLDFKEPVKELSYNICPRCKVGTLRRIDGRYGPFMGCSTYPICRYTKNA